VNASRTTALSIVHRHLPQPSAADFGWIGIYGGQGRNRTADASLFRAALYRLSYLAKIILPHAKFRETWKEILLV
jgi:hypothetical protein